MSNNKIVVNIFVDNKILCSHCKKLFEKEEMMKKTPGYYYKTCQGCRNRMLSYRNRNITVINYDLNYNDIQITQPHINCNKNNTIKCKKKISSKVEKIPLELSFD